MDRLTLLLFALLLATDCTHAAWKPDKDGAGESFEADGVPGYVEAEKSRVAVSAKRYKHGSRSLCWATTPGAKLTVRSPQLKANGSSKNAGVMLWYYNETPQEDKLTFHLLSDDKEVYRFQAGLSFSGWRAIWVCFRQDLKPVQPKARLQDEITMTVTTPPKGAGDIYFDAIRFPKSTSWRRTKDNQVPFVRASTETHWQDSYDASLIKPAPPPARISAEEKQAFALMTKRYDDWALGRTLNENMPQRKAVLDAMQTHIQRGKAYFKKLNIKYADGAYTGQPFFAGRSSLTPNFCQDLFQNAPLPLALDYRVNGNEQSAKDFVTLINFAHDQGWADGSGIGTLDHEMLRAAGYMHAVFLMRDVLRKDGILERELATMRWHCFFNSIYREPKHAGVNADRCGRSRSSCFWPFWLWTTRRRRSGTCAVCSAGRTMPAASLRAGPIQLSLTSPASTTPGSTPTRTRLARFTSLRSRPTCSTERVSLSIRQVW